MKKILLLVVLVFFSVAAYPNRMAIFFFLYSHYFHRPENVAFAKHETANIRIFYVRSPFLNSRIQQISERLTRNLARAETEVGAKLNSVMTVYLYNDWEEKGNDERDIRVADADPDSNAIHCIVNGQYDGLKEGLEYQLLLKQRYGAPARPEFLTYDGAALSGTWNQKTLQEWSEFLAARKLQPNFTDPLSPSHALSEYLQYPWNAIFFQFVKEKFGWNAMIDVYRTGGLPKDYENAWSDYLAKIPVAEIQRSVFHQEFQKGISYAYSNGYDAGYPTRKSAGSLDELKTIGVNWVAAIPYGFMRNESPEIHFAGHDIFGESDESMIALMDAAKQRGMKVMMKPQIWIHHDSWPGSVNFDNQAQWDQFMNNYESWILHYAILSELHGANLLCIGTEFVQATTKNPERWRRLIARVREVYHGPLVYAANYGKEFEEIAFWDALDYIGLDNYYPVRASNTEGIEAMKAGFLRQKEKLQAMALRYHKPLLFTEIGYMANDSAGMGPAEANDDHYNEQMQAECYRMAMETYWNEPWFAGMYWWKWFSDGSDRGKEADRHSPHGRAAEMILKDWYKRSHS